MNIGILLKCGIIIGSLILGALSTYLFKMHQDNALEQFAESIIKDQSGVDIDISPDIE